MCHVYVGFYHAYTVFSVSEQLQRGLEVFRLKLVDAVSCSFFSFQNCDRRIHFLL